MSQHRSVPRLDLAPKLKRPLSLWNPLDYLRLLYWVFFFPQALRWYVDTFGGGYIPDEELNWRNPIQRHLLVQGLILTAATPLALSLLLLGIGVPLNWFNVASGVGTGVAAGVTFGGILGTMSSVWLGIVFGVAFGVMLGAVSATALNVALVLTLGLTSDVAEGVASGIVFGVVLGVASGVVSGVASGVASGVVSRAASGVAFALGGGLASGMVLGITLPVAFLGTLSLAFSVAILRPESWLFGLDILLKSRNRNWWFPRVTPLPVPSLASQLTNWLRQDWETGLHNANELLAYTLQFIPVVKAVNQVLAETPPEQVIYRVAQLTIAPYDWQLVRFASQSFLLFPPRRRQLLQPYFVTDTTINTSARAVAGFWHLYATEPVKAMEAFAVVRSLPYGEQMFTLVQTLAAFYQAKELGTIAALQIPTFPNEPFLRPTTWEVIASLRRVVEDVQVVQRSVSDYARASALGRAFGKLTNILNNADTLPQAERGLIVDIAHTWKEALLQVADEVGEISISKPVSNPYVVGDPVQGNLFVGREDVLRQLEEFWVMGHQLQSVVLYGHRRMGKTSILNAANCSGAEVKVAYVNLLLLGSSPQGVGEVLMAISDAISEAVDCTPPTDTDLLNLPYRTFERYLRQVEAHLSGGLIVALDEFEKIEELIEAEKIPKDFMGYLRGLVQMSSKVAFAFAGLHTLEEMTADYFQPFFASVIPIHVGFLPPWATRQILANPDEDFPLDYTPEALDQIYALTAGQPYLVQLVGFQLVRRYNDYVFEQGRPRDPVFTVEDVEAVINDPEFFKRGRYYFDGVWGQAARGASGQQAILKVLAPHPQGLNIDALAQATGMEEKTLQEALKTLKRHDVVEEREGCWQIIVELFRRWVLQP